MGGNRASRRRSAKRLSLARSLDDLEVGIDSLRLKRAIFFQRSSPSLWLLFFFFKKTFRFRCLELALAALTVARGRSQSVLCVGHSCGPVCLASLMSTGAWLETILGVAEEPFFLWWSLHARADKKRAHLWHKDALEEKWMFFPVF